MTDLVKLMGIKGDKVKLSGMQPMPDGQIQRPGFKALNPRTKHAPQQYAGAVSPINKALNSKMA